MSSTQAAPVAGAAGAGDQGRLRLERTLFVIGVIALGYNLRDSISTLPPLFPELQDRLGLSSAAISLLAATPVICFGVVSGFAATIARRVGDERTLLAAIIVLTVGLIARALAPSVLLFPGTIAASAAIAVMNVLLSSLIKRRWPERAGMLIGLYITALSLGAIAGSVASVPLWDHTGGSIAITLGWIAAPASLAILLWLPQLSSGGATPRTPRCPRVRARSQKPRSYRARTSGRPSAGATTSGTSQLSSGGATPRTPRCPLVRARSQKPRSYRARTRGRPSRGGVTPRTRPVPSPQRVPVYRYALAWYVTIFMGMQSLLYYAALSWLPSILRDRGESAAGAGDLVAVMGVGNLAVSLIVPVAAQRMRGQRGLIVATAVAMAAGLAGLVYAPLGGAVAWALILGAGQNAALALAIFFTAARAPQAAIAASLSALAQGVGYLLASAGPLEVGLLHSVTGSWTVPLLVLFALTVVLLIFGLLAARPRMLPDQPRMLPDQ